MKEIELSVLFEAISFSPEDLRAIAASLRRGINVTIFASLVNDLNNHQSYDKPSLAN